MLTKLRIENYKLKIFHFSFFILQCALLCATDVVIDIRKTGGQVGLALSLSPESLLAEEITFVLRQDLEASGIVQILEGDFPVDKELSFPDRLRQRLLLLGGHALLGISSSQEGGHLQLSANLYEGMKGSRIYSFRQKLDARELRPTLHQLADEALKALTGEKGVARTRIAFINTATGRKELYLADYDGGNLKRLTQDNSIALLPAWSADGKKIYYTSFKNGNPNLYLLDLEAKKERLISASRGLNSGASTSPDGKWVGLTLSKDGDPEIYLVGEKGEHKRLTHSRGMDFSPSFSPNGREIAFISERGGFPQIYAMDAQGGNVRLLFSGGFCDSPGWSPRGEGIVFTQRQGVRQDIYFLDIHTQKAARLTENSGSNESPCFSPDGRQIIFSSTRRGKSDIFVMRPDGSHQRPLNLEASGESTSPVWSPAP